MDIGKLRNDIKELATKAVELDKLDKYEEAADNYIKAATRLQTLIKYDQNPYNKDIYTKKAKEYLDAMANYVTLERDEIFVRSCFNYSSIKYSTINIS